MQIETQQKAPAEQFRAWVALHPQLTLTLLVLLSLAPFVTKPFNMDDPLFIWAAKQIQAHPLDPYGFNVNWYDRSEPMWTVTKNPPLACYYLALAASIAGWSEVSLHGAFLLPAIAAILGTYRLAKHFCARPVFAACATLFTPVFLVSSTSIMCDTLMLAFWVWAMVFWVEYFRADPHTRREWKCRAAGFLILLAALTKYFGVCLVPLLAAYGAIEQKKAGRWIFPLLLPVVGMALYQWLTFRMYGRGLFSDAATYAGSANLINMPMGIQTLTGLAFTGGCLAVATFFAPLVWRGRPLLLMAVMAIVYASVIFGMGAIWTKYGRMAGTSHELVIAQMVVWLFGGIIVLALAASDLWQRRNADSALLLLWIVGTFLFATFFNWVTNGRSILPMAPAVGILLARRLEPDAWQGRATPHIRLWAVMTACAALALLVTRADCYFAEASEQLAGQVVAKYGHRDGTLWFGGHWGWQYYMEQFGARAVIAKKTVPKDGDFLVLSRNNTNPLDVNKKLLQTVEIMRGAGPRNVTSINTEVGAGFYASIWGPLPFAIGKVPPEAALVALVKIPPSAPPKTAP